VTRTKVNLGTVQETLLIPLWARAVELKQPDPILRDPKSAEIMATIDYDFDKFNHAKSSQVGCCLRGFIFDNWVRQFLDQHPQATIVEIGAGLNTRFERVDNGQVRWFDLDLPDVMTIRQQFFQPSDRHHFIAASALDLDWIAQVKAASNAPYLFVVEGVLMYLKEAQVMQLFAHLMQHFPGALTAFDSMSALMAKNQRQHDIMKNMEAQFDWHLSDVRKIQKWDDRYQVLEIVHFNDLPISYWQRFSLKERILFSLPVLRSAYRLALVKLGT
jgi:O-methyltransferase involved in polyketide biosynthesis